MFNLLPNNLKYGKDIKSILFYKDTVYKTFKNKVKYQETEFFLDLVKNDPHFPKIIKKELIKNSISMTHCGNLLNLYTLPKNWKTQFYTIRDILSNKGYYILDLRFLPYTPYVVNNVCVKDNTIYIVDVNMFKKRSKTYINYKINFLIYKISLYLTLINYPIILYFCHIILEIMRMIEDLIEILLFRDISIFDELKNIKDVLVN